MIIVGNVLTLPPTDEVLQYLQNTKNVDDYTIEFCTDTTHSAVSHDKLT